MRRRAPEVRRCTDRLRNHAAQHREVGEHRQNPGRLVTDQVRSGQEDLSTAQAIGPSGSLSTAQATRPSGRLVTDQAGLEPERLGTDQAPVSGKLDDAAMTSPITPSRPFDHPAAWTAADLGGKDAFAFDLTDRHIAAFEAAAQGCAVKVSGVTGWFGSGS